MIDVLTAMMERIVRLESRLAHVVQHGSVHEVDPKEQKVRLRLGGADDEPFLSPWVPYSQMGGAFKGHVPPTKGQNMTMLSPGGVPEQAFAAPMTFNNEFKSPSDKADENVFTYGDVKIEVRASEAVVSLGGTQIKLTGDGVFINGDVQSTGDFDHIGGTLKHDGKNIGKTHIHGSVQSGGGVSGAPAD